jgi:hypothetical protein
MQGANRPFRLPIRLALAGVALLSGCLYIPSSYTTQGNGKPRPESIIGKDERSPIVLGQTSIGDALPRVFDQVTGLPEIDPRQLLDLRALRTAQPFAALTDWRYLSINAERRQVAVPYRLKTATILYPFAITPKTNMRLLVLTSDASGVVVAKETIEPDDLAKRGLTPIERDPSQLMNLLGTMLREQFRGAPPAP